MKVHKFLAVVVFLLVMFAFSNPTLFRTLAESPVAEAAHLEGDLQPNEPDLPSYGPGYLSISAVAFQPGQDGYDYFITGFTISPNDFLSPNYYAPVYLPDGATVNQLTCYWEDSSITLDGWCDLYRVLMSASFSRNKMGEVRTQDSSGNMDNGSDTSIDYAEVDNSLYSYHVHWYLPFGVRAGSVRIGYGYVLSMPIVQH